MDPTVTDRAEHRPPPAEVASADLPAALRELAEAGLWLADAQGRLAAAQEAYSRAATAVFGRAVSGLFELPDGEHLEVSLDAAGRPHAGEPQVVRLAELAGGAG